MTPTPTSRGSIPVAIELQSGAHAGGALVVEATVRVLDECSAFVRSLSPTIYTSPSRVLPGGTVGKHLRHTLDHFGAIAGAIGAIGTPPVIDYDHRERDVPMETDLRAGMDTIARVRARIAAALAEELAASVRVRVMCDASGAEAEVPSTVARELAFATHHAVHHQAMMRAIAREFGHDAAPSFGVAPSTLRHESRRGGALPGDLRS